MIKVKEESKNAGLKLNIQKMKIKASGSIIDAEKKGNSDRHIFWGSKISAEHGCSHEIKRHLLLGRKAMINLEILLCQQMSI